jgi:hypothetical protein
MASLRLVFSGLKALALGGSFGTMLTYGHQPAICLA